MLKPLAFSAALWSAALAPLALGIAAGLAPAPAAAQTTPVALTQALEANMDRPLTPPEAWAAASAAQSHASDVRRIRDAFAARVVEITRLSPDAVAGVIPPLGRGPQSAMPDDLEPALSQALGRPLTAAEAAALRQADAERRDAISPHRRTLAERLERLTDLPADRITPLLEGLGL
ncbi:hypothetical protein [Caenispirillum salinarum]|uniref:hypothetical protein n=1 Tax=Caenispirillum salinarum TaxID=859058 RepID=UPI00384CE661